MKEQTKDRRKKRKQRIGNESGKNLARKGFEKKKEIQIKIGLGNFAPAFFGKSGLDCQRVLNQKSKLLKGKVRNHSVFLVLRIISC